MTTPLRVLHLEASRLDAELIRSTLAAGGVDHDLVHVQNREEFEAAVGRDRFDVILSDFALPDSDGVAALDFARRAAPGVPFILVSGTLGEELAVECLKAGATDYILKERLNRLVPAVQRAAQEAAERAERRRAEDALEGARRHTQLILQSTAEGIFGLDSNGRATFANPAAANILGYAAEDLVGQQVHALLRHTRPDGSLCQEHNCPIVAAYQRGVPHHGEDGLFWRKDGASFQAAYVSSPIRNEQNELVGCVVTFRDITARKQAEAELAAAPFFYQGQPGVQVIARDITEGKRAARERQQMEQRLRQTERMASFGQLAAKIVDEFRQPASSAQDGPASGAGGSGDLAALMRHYEKLIEAARQGPLTAGQLAEAAAARAQVSDQVVANLCTLLMTLTEHSRAAGATGARTEASEADEQERLLTALQETVEVLKLTKRSFKSRALGDLRGRLEQLLEKRP